MVIPISSTKQITTAKQSLQQLLKSSNQLVNHKC